MTWVKLNLFLIRTYQATVEIVSQSHYKYCLNLHCRNMDVKIIVILIKENRALEDNPC